MKLILRSILPVFFGLFLLASCDTPSSADSPNPGGSPGPGDEPSGKSSNADLIKIDISLGTLEPAFSPEIVSYTVRLDTYSDSISLFGYTAEKNAKIEGGGFMNVSLSEGTNKFAMEVTAENGVDKKTYNFRVEVPKLILDYLSENVGTLKYIVPGRFQYSKNADDVAEITKAFRIGDKEISRAQFKKIMGVDPSLATWGNDSNPVDHVPFFAAIIFCNKLSILEGLTPVYDIEGFDFESFTYEVVSNENLLKNYWEKLIPGSITCDWNATGYRLPTSMEWSWAAMSATVDPSVENYIDRTSWQKQWAGHDLNEKYPDPIGSYAVRSSFFNDTTMPGGSKLPNEAQLYDMTGNVSEWVWDCVSDSPQSGSIVDWRGAENDDPLAYRYHKGGDSLAAANDTGVLRLFSNRPWTGSGTQGREQWIGFRVVCN